MPSTIPKPRQRTPQRADHRSPAAVVCEVFGSAAELARLLGLAKSSTWRWLRSGLVPAQYHATLLDHAERMGLTLTADDLVRGRAATENDDD